MRKEGRAISEPQYPQPEQPGPQQPRRETTAVLDVEDATSTQTQPVTPAAAADATTPAAAADPTGPPPWNPLPDSDAEPAKPARRVSAGIVAAILAAGLVGGGIGAVVTNQLDDSTTTVRSAAPGGVSNPIPRSAGDLSSVSEVAAAVLPSVVSIEVRGNGGGGEGSGVVISADGRILTNNHVVAAAASGGQLRVTFSDGQTAAAEIVGRDPGSDIAVIQAQGRTDLTPATLGDPAGLAVGEQVVAIGSPLGLQGTVTTGVVSALDRPVVIGTENGLGAPDGRTVIDAVQTDAAINPGNSGGALVNMSGEVIGINTAIASLQNGLGGQAGSIGLGFAIPIDQASRIAEQLADGEQVSRAFLGVSVGDRNAAGEPVQGAAVTEIQPDSPAAAAGLEVGDVITQFGDRRIDGPDALVAAVRSESPGTAVTVNYLRDGQASTVEVTLGTRSEQ
ncbi:MAG: trypsin-like peptidase domain-containing protein [Sporichthyaceae bacterium]|nr:trypsin-like peptidase domain-containing protein [Sporichthyaceae bacterium]